MNQDYTNTTCPECGYETVVDSIIERFTCSSCGRWNFL